MMLRHSRIEQVKANTDIVAIIEAVGIELRPAGGERLKGLCPLHSEKTPSFIVYQDQHYHCFGCGQGGDVIDFIQETRGLSFPEALKALGADDWRPSAADLRATQARQRRQKAQKRRERDLAYTLGRAIRIAEKTLADTDNPDWKVNVLILQHLETLKYQHQIFIDGDADDRVALVKDLVTITPLPRGELFNKDFDYRRWVSETGKSTEQRNEQGNY